MDRTLDDTRRNELYMTIMENLDEPYNCRGYFMNADRYWSGTLFGVPPPEGSGRLLRKALDGRGREVTDPEKDLAAGIHAFTY